MKRGNRYYLIARDKKMNQITYIPVKECDYSLESIDLFTSQYNNAESLVSSLIEKGLLSSTDIDFYIVYPKKYKGETLLKSEEVIFNFKLEIKGLTYASLHNRWKECFIVEPLINRFCYRMYHNHDFYNKVIFGKTNIYSKFARYFFMDQMDYSCLKHIDGGWIRSSYPLLRNIISVLDEDYRNVDHSHDQIFRDLFVPKLLEMTSIQYDFNQINALSLMGYKTKEEKIIEIINTISLLENACLFDGVFSKEVNDILNFYFSHKEDDVLEETQIRLLKWFQKNPGDIDTFYSIIDKEMVMGECNGYQKRKKCCGVSKV